MRDQNLYELLQVSPNADPEIIQAAYRRLILRYHPDRSSDPNAAEMTQRLNDAYAILSDPARRVAYDSDLRQRTSGSASGAGQTSSRTSQSRPNPPPPPRPPPRPPKQPTEKPPTSLEDGFAYRAYQWADKPLGRPSCQVIIMTVFIVLVTFVVAGLVLAN